MNTQQRYEALVRIQKQLELWAAHQPNHHFRLYGGKEINECIQLCKQAVSQSALELMVEENQKMGLYLDEDDSVNQSLGLANIN